MISQSKEGYYIYPKCKEKSGENSFFYCDTHEYIVFGDFV